MRSVRRRYHTVSVVSFSLLWAAFVVLFVLISSDAFAAPVTYETVRVGPGQYAPSGVTSPITVNVKGPGVSKFHQIVPVATPSTIGKLGRALVRGGGVGIVITGAVEGLGYLIDQATGEIKKEIVVPPPDGSGWTGSFNVAGFVAGTPEGACSAASAPYGSRITIGDNPGYFGYCYKLLPSGDIYARWNIVGSGSYNEPVETTAIVDLDPSDYQIIDNKLNTALSLAEKMAILKHFLNQLAPSGTVSTDNYPVSISSSNSQLEQLYSDWPELRQSLQQLVNAVLAEQLALADPEFSPSPDEQTIVDQGLDSPPLSPDFELPAFCEWASFICEPFVGGDQPDVPMLDLEAPNYDSGLPQTASCPAPVVIETQWFGSLNLSYEPACQFASGIRVPLLAISYLVSGFIVVGVRR
jgi:hypothetical protein